MDAQSYVDLERLLEAGNNPPSVKKYSRDVEEKERLRVILEAAKNNAISVGMQSKLDEATSIVKAQERRFDAIYNFEPLMIQRKIQPPVISEARDIKQNPDDLTIKTTGAIYKIEQQARVVNIAPNWRSYLSFPKTSYDSGINESVLGDLAPRTYKEKELWKKATIEGFKEGLEQGAHVVEYAMNKLNRDYIGMIRFHQFAMEGRLTMPALTRQSLALSNNGDSIAIDQELLTLHQLPSFNGNIDSWKTIGITPAKDNANEQMTINKVD